MVPFLDTTNLVEHFKLMTEAEVVYLLTTFANMARARTLEDRDFICAVGREIYEVSSVGKLYMFKGDKAIYVHDDTLFCW